MEDIHKNKTNSFNEDLELFFKNLQLGKSPQEESVTYFVSMLTVEELELAEKRDSNYIANNYYPDWQKMK